MAASRRDFLRRTCAGAAAWNALGLAPGATRACELTVEMDTDERARLAAFALEMARKEGATYADIRINRYRNQMISFRAQFDRATRKPVEVPRVADSESFGFGIRVLAEGTWGFASSFDVSKDAIARAAAHAVEIAKANAPLRRRPVHWRRPPHTKTATGPPSPLIRFRCRSRRSLNFSAPFRPRPWRSKGSSRSMRSSFSAARTGSSRRATAA